MTSFFPEKIIIQFSYLMKPNVRFNWVFKLGCVSMASLVVLGAMYGHKGKLDEDGIAYFHKAQFYHLANSLGFFASSMVTPASPALKVAVGGFLVGTLVFCCPLYFMAISGRNQFISKTMPVGGLGMIIGWLSLIFA